MRITLISSICALSLVFLSCSKKAAEQNGVDLALVKESDSSMNRAIAEAKRTLPEFLKRLSSPALGDTLFLVKVMVHENNGTEHLWVNSVKPSGTGFEGIVDNKPQFVTSVKHNGVIRFAQDAVTDWAFTDSNGIRQGSYTIKVLLAGMPSKDAAAYRDLFGWEDTVGAGLRKESAK